MKHVVAWFLLVWLSVAAQAHQTPGSAIDLETRGERLHLTITIPESEWRFAYGARAPTPVEISSQLALQSEEGGRWAVMAPQLDKRLDAGVMDLVFRVEAQPPAGHSIRQFKLGWSGVIDRVASHRVLVAAKADFAGGVLEGQPRLLGVLQGNQRVLEVDLGDASRWKGFSATFLLGMHHIAEGADHLMFLLALLLAAPGLAASGRWSATKPPRDTIWMVLSIITAFTLGHSMTLILGAALNWSLPVQPVEIAIALSVLISAVHAARPIFAGREFWVAGGFGLVHGLAFATVLANFALPAGERALAILGFNLGIEFVQIALALLVLPALIYASNRPFWARIRTIGAVIAGSAALFWLGQRI